MLPICVASAVQCAFWYATDIGVDPTRTVNRVCKMLQPQKTATTLHFELRKITKILFPVSCQLNAYRLTKLYWNQIMVLLPGQLCPYLLR